MVCADKIAQVRLIQYLIKILWSRSLGRVVLYHTTDLRSIDWLSSCVIPRSNITIPRLRIHKGDQDWTYVRWSNVIEIWNWRRRSGVIVTKMMIDSRWRSRSGRMIDYRNVVATWNGDRRLVMIMTWNDDRRLVWSWSTRLWSTIVVWSRSGIVIND